MLLMSDSLAIIKIHIMQFSIIGFDIKMALKNESHALFILPTGSRHQSNNATHL